MKYYEFVHNQKFFLILSKCFWLFRSIWTLLTDDWWYHKFGWCNHIDVFCLILAVLFIQRGLINPLNLARTSKESEISSVLFHTVLLSIGRYWCTDKVSPFESISGVSRSYVVMQPSFILLTRYRPNLFLYQFVKCWESLQRGVKLKPSSW